MTSHNAMINLRSELTVRGPAEGIFMKNYALRYFIFTSHSEYTKIINLL